MPRTARVLPDNSIQHVINRGNKREMVFTQLVDYEDFFCLLAEAQTRIPIRILVVCVMGNHFHIVFWIEHGDQLSAYMQWLMTKQISRYQRRHQIVGTGHVYQDRYRNFMVQDDAHLFKVLRYVEANPLRAGMVQRAEDYRWSSLSRRLTPDGRNYLADWPLPRPTNWCDYVNQGIAASELDALRHCARRGAPFGEEQWVQHAADTYGLGHTLGKRPRE
jgi:putative transposase